MSFFQSSTQWDADGLYVAYADIVFSDSIARSPNYHQNPHPQTRHQNPPHPVAHSVAHHVAHQVALRKLQHAEGDICVVVDRDFRRHVSAERSFSEVETVSCGETGLVAKIGKQSCEGDGEAFGEFIGLLKVSAVASALTARTALR